MACCPTLETERLVLRPFRDDDLEAFTSVLTAEPVRRSLHLPDDVGREQAWREMALWLGQWQLRGTGNWAVEERATGRLVGRAGLHRPERPDWPGVEVGWTFHPEVWGRGYATEAGRRAVVYGFDTLRLHALYSVILPGNVASQRVAAKLGFRLVDERVLSHFPTQPHGIWRLLREEWTGVRDGPVP
jgi:RimJ/RimL family protein N-acetyltransferase